MLLPLNRDARRDYAVSPKAYIGIEPASFRAGGVAQYSSLWVARELSGVVAPAVSAAGELARPLEGYLTIRSELSVNATPLPWINRRRPLLIVGNYATRCTQQTLS